MRRFLTDMALLAGALAIAVVLLFAALVAAHYPAMETIRIWIHGAVGSTGDILEGCKNACPLILTGLAAGVAFRCGVFNIGAEGQALIGAAAGVALATRLFPAIATSWLGIPLALVAAAIGGALWALIAALLERYRHVPVVLSTILLNFIALQLVGVFLETVLRTHENTAQIKSDALAAAFQLPAIFSADQRTIHLGFLIALLIAAALWLMQARTTFGFEIWVTGLNPVAARYAGMPVAARQFSIMLISGALAGIAGMMQVMAVEGHTMEPGLKTYGFAGIAVALLGRLHPAGIVLAALFFSFLDHGANSFEFTLPPETADVFKGVLVLLILIGTAAIARRRTTARER